MFLLLAPGNGVTSGLHVPLGHKDELAFELEVINTVQMSLDIILFSACVIFCVKGKGLSRVFFNVSGSCACAHTRTQRCHFLMTM